MKTAFKIAASILLLLYFINSFNRYYNLSLDGDMAPIILPSPAYSAVLSDPFGINVLLHDSVYPATNRFFTHFIISAYFKVMPNTFQTFVSPLNSVYLSSAVALLLMHFLLLYMLAVYISGQKKISHPVFLFSALIIAPLFLFYGYHLQMAIVLTSVTYSFFYTLSMIFLLLFFLPFFNHALERNQSRFSSSYFFFLLIVATVSSFSGSLNAPVTLIISFAILFHTVTSCFITKTEEKQHSFREIFFKKIPTQHLFLIIAAIILSLYSFYIGRNNSENLWQSLSLSERYRKLFLGLRYHYTEQLGPGLLLTVVIFNFIIITKLNPSSQIRQVILIFKYFLGLSVLYILMLPFGGYREYRPYLIRCDTVMPVNIGMILFYGFSVIYLLYQLKEPAKRYSYIVLVLGVNFTFVHADGNFKVNNYNQCERQAISRIAQAPSSIVHIPADCTVMEWNIIKEASQSRYITDMFLYWNITREKKLFYQK